MNQKNPVQLIECPRDAIQGIQTFIPTKVKTQYIQQLLSVGFHTIDMGSFVSPKAIPQMADTGSVIQALDTTDTSTELLVIIANMRGAEEAVKYENIRFLGFPFSISETFQIRNTNATREEAFERIQAINEVALKNDKKLVLYFSMCFGNPYGDLWHPDIVTYWTRRFEDLGASVIALSDTVGIGTPKIIHTVVQQMRAQFATLDFGVHLHTHPHAWKEKIEAAYEAGCTRFDAAIGGYGGCPMAQDELIGNMPTAPLANYFIDKGLLDLNIDKFRAAQTLFSSILGQYATS